MADKYGLSKVRARESFRLAVSGGHCSGVET